MINTVASVGLIALISLGATLVTWSSFLMLSNQTDGEFVHFIRMLIGWFFLVTGWWFV